MLDRDYAKSGDEAKTRFSAANSPLELSKRGRVVLAGAGARL
jgi:hypothetical protein